MAVADGPRADALREHSAVERLHLHRGQALDRDVAEARDQVRLDDLGVGLHRLGAQIGPGVGLQPVVHGLGHRLAGAVHSRSPVDVSQPCRQGGLRLLLALCRSSCAVAACRSTDRARGRWSRRIVRARPPPVAYGCFLAPSSTPLFLYIKLRLSPLNGGTRWTVQPPDGGRGRKGYCLLAARPFTRDSPSSSSLLGLIDHRRMRLERRV